MIEAGERSAVERRLSESLYAEAMLLADESRHYFDAAGRVERALLDPMARVAFSCESLKVTTRLMHAVAWLLTERAVVAGELAPKDALHPSRRLGEAPVTDAATLAAMPDDARGLVRASIELHRRVARLEAARVQEGEVESPALALLGRLRGAF